MELKEKETSKGTFVGSDKDWHKYKEIRNKDILALLDEKELNSQYLELGEHKDEENEFWYYGFKLKGRECIITSDGKIFRNTLQKVKGEKGEEWIGENEIKAFFNYEGYIGSIAPVIKKELIKQIYTGETPIIDVKNLYETVRDKILYFMDFGEEDEIADVLTCWTISTYCYPLFYWFSPILINAPSGSGKTKCATILTYLSYRGFELGASGGVTPAQMFRTIEGNRGTMMLDEFEHRQGEQASDTQQLVYQVINSSPTKDAYVIRNVQEGKKWHPTKFPIFSPKICCNISGVNPTSLSRFIYFKWLKTNNKVKGSRKPQKPKEKQQFEAIRNDLYVFILQNWKGIKEKYETIDIPELKNREEDNWQPLFAVATFVDEAAPDLKVVEQLKKYVKNSKEFEIETNDETEEFFRLLQTLVGEEDKYWQPKEIVATCVEIQEMFKLMKQPATKVGRLLKQYKFKFKRTGIGMQYLLNKERVGYILELYFNGS